MPEVLRLDIPAGATRCLVQPRAALDPATTAEVERQVAAARAAAYQEGERAGREAARAELATAVAAVERAAGAVRTELETQRAEATRASLTLAEAVATAVVDATPPAEALALLARVEEAAAALDDDPIRVSLSAADHAALSAASSDASIGDRRLELVADPRLQPGQARLEGSFGGTDLTRRALLTAALEVLGEGAV